MNKSIESERIMKKKELEKKRCRKKLLEKIMKDLNYKVSSLQVSWNKKEKNVNC